MSVEGSKLLEFFKLRALGIVRDLSNSIKANRSDSDAIYLMFFLKTGDNDQPFAHILRG